MVKLDHDRSPVGTSVFLAIAYGIASALAIVAVAAVAMLSLDAAGMATSAAEAPMWFGSMGSGGAG